MDCEKEKPTKITKWIEEHDLLTLCQQTMKNRNLQNGSKSTNHGEERDLLTLLNSMYSFSKTSTMLIDGSED